MECVSSARATVQAVSDSVEFVLPVDREVRAFGCRDIGIDLGGRRKPNNKKALSMSLSTISPL
jgi:hypothetical protein